MSCASQSFHHEGHEDPWRLARALRVRRNAFRKFAAVRFPLYLSRGIGTYRGNENPSPDPKATAARRPGIDGSDQSKTQWISRRVGRHGGTRLDADPAARPWTQTTCPPPSIAPSVDVSCDAGRGHVGRALLRVVRRAAGEQFLVRSARPPALGDFCRPDAPGAAPGRNAPPPPRRVSPRSMARNTA